MDVESFLASVRKSKIIKFAKDTIPKTLEAIRREETLVQGDIVVFEIPGDALNRLISEELSAPSQAYTWLRILPHDWVEPFIQDRLATYDRMWSGCGCRVHFEQEWAPKEDGDGGDADACEL
eukprot:TRINITY_DN431_c0_g1_i1.p1 TRINITY_DN431_c0_g1~~TRINITY_DN431_c0_g1_i1.p1  ORF type:complete len:122 (+),score=32.74 TRINITY_DN431_c0_g1_i1:157-522(+)